MKNFNLTVFCILSFFVAQTQTKNFIDLPYVEVIGTVDTLVTPNEIYVKIVISEKDTRDRTSLEELEIRMINTLKSLGVDTEKDLTTNDISSNFRFYLLKAKDVLKGKQYILKVRDAMAASKIFLQLEETGISNLSIDRVDHSDLENIRGLMRTKAMANAKSRAIALTQPLGQTVGPAIHITDTETYANQLQGRLAGVVITGYSVRKNDKDEAPKIDFEKIRISTSVNVKFMLK